MIRPTLPAWSKIAGAGATATGGGSWLITLGGVPRTTAIIVAAIVLAVTSIAAAIAVTLPQIVIAIQEHKAGVLRAEPEVIKAKSEAEASRRWTKTQDTIVRAGLKSQEGAERAERLLRMHALSPGLKEGQRLPDEVLDRHLTPHLNRTTAKKPAIPKDISGNGSIVPFQPTHNLSTRLSFRSHLMTRDSVRLCGRMTDSHPACGVAQPQRGTVSIAPADDDHTGAADLHM